MDFDLSKENIQPLRGGRNVTQLGVALQAQSDMDHQLELMQQKEEFEKLIKSYTGVDPLENWYNYISWIEQSYPKQGHEGNLNSLLEQCLKIFENDHRYQEDRRLCKLFIKFIDQQQNPLELFHMMYAQRLCRSCADMYRAWAYYYEAAGDFQNAHRIFEYGKREFAQPYEELQAAHESLVIAAGQHIIYGPNVTDLSEKRQALTSLQTYKSGQVASFRQGSTTAYQPGVFRPSTLTRPNAAVPVFEDRGDPFRSGFEAAPSSVITAARRQEVPKENTLQPGPWTKVFTKTKDRRTPSFTVHEDDDKNDIEILNPVPTTLENYSDWIVTLTIPEPKDDRLVPMYPKARVYSHVNTEFSLEELRMERYLTKKEHQPTEAIYIEDDDDEEKETDNVKNSAAVKTVPNNPDQILHQSNLIYKGNNSMTTNGGRILSPQDNKRQTLVANHWKATRGETSSNALSIPENSQVNFDLWSSSPSKDTSVAPVSKSNAPRFTIYEQSNLVLQEHMEPKGSAMKTPFNDLNAEDLAETGSRGGMDVAAAAPVDSAKRVFVFEDDNSSSSFDKPNEPQDFEDVTCNTQMFGFNLNVMQVSTPQNKGLQLRAEEDLKMEPKQLFAETKREDEKVLSTILEEPSKCYGQSSSSSSSAAGTKSSISANNTKPRNMVTISEEHNSYLAQNLSVNAALRSTLGDLMDFGGHSSHIPVPQKSYTPGANNRSESGSMTIPTAVKVSPLTYIPSNPFGQSLIEDLLKRVQFPGPHTQGYNYLANILKLTVRKEVVTVGVDRYIIEKQLGKGTFGVVFRAVDIASGQTVAAKYQKPANKWEYYICRELQSRLANHPLRERFMDVTIAYFCDNASVLISDFMPCGSLLDVANLVKQKSGRPMKESLCIHFCLEMLRVVQAMHGTKIIHADIKPDNFLVKIFPNDVVGLQLIDFGCSIDMSLFPDGASFLRKVTTEDFVCCEMKDGRPWNYHTDLFCIAATAHVLLFEKYIQMQKRDGHWSITSRLPRYARVDLWNMFFSTLLNQHNGPADSGSLQAMLEDSLNHKFDDYHNELRFLTNMLKNR